MTSAQRPLGSSTLTFSPVEVTRDHDIYCGIYLPREKECSAGSAQGSKGQPSEISFFKACFPQVLTSSAQKSRVGFIFNMDKTE